MRGARCPETTGTPVLMETSCKRHAAIILHFAGGEWAILRHHGHCPAANDGARTRQEGGAADRRAKLKLSQEIPLAHATMPSLGENDE
jgi:hypothetical protein